MTLFKTKCQHSVHASMDAFGVFSPLLQKWRKSISQSVV